MNPDPASEGWTLDPQLARDTRPIGDLPLCRVLLIDDANYPWLLLVPRRRGVSELSELSYVSQAQLMTEIVAASRALKAIADCDKINVAALGNVVAQLHVHVIARKRSDAAWPKPVWGVAPALAYAAPEPAGLIGQLRQSLALSPV